MPGKTYNAGTIFLQVVPVFGDVQNSIRRQANDWNKALGDDLERGGRDAGERAGKAMAEEMEKHAGEAGDKSGKEYAGHFETHMRSAVRSAQKELDGINFRTASDKSLKDLERIKHALKDLGDTDFKVDFDAKKALAKLEIINATLDDLAKTDHEINVQANIQKTRADLKRIEEMVDRTVAKRRELTIVPEIDRKQLDRAMGAFETRIRETAKRAARALGDPINAEAKRIKAELEGLGDAEIGIDISDRDARQKIEDLMLQARRLSMTSADISVKVDAGKAEIELARLHEEINKVDGDDINIKVDVDTRGAAAKIGALRGLFNGNGAESAANSFRSFNAIVLAAVTLLPALVPAAGVAGGALLGLIPIAGAVGSALGAMLIGFSGIGDALTALGNQADTAAYDTNQASKTMQSAAYAVQDAQDALAAAELNAGRAAQDAARQVAQAREQAARAIRDALERQREAQEAYANSVQDVKDAEEALRLARQQAKRDMEDTKNQIVDNALDIRQAQLDAFNATNNYNAVMADGSSTAYDREAASIEMEQAKQRLHELRVEQQRLAKERKKQDKDGVDGSKTVRDAQEQLTQAIQAQEDAERSLGDAARAVDQARVDGARAVQDALRNQARAQADGARSVAQAQEQLRRAQEGYNQALYDTGDIGSASARNVAAAMSKLGPAGQRFARFIFGLRDEAYAFRDSIQEAMLPAVQRAISRIISKYGPQFTGFMTRMAGVVGRFFTLLERSLEGPAWQRFFGIMNRLGPIMAAQFGKATLDWMETFANLMSASAPFAMTLSRGMLAMSDAVAKWSGSKAGQKVMTDFFQWVRDTGPAVIKFLGAFVRAAINLTKALAPWGTTVLKALTGILNWIANMDPKTLGLIASSIIGMTIAWQAAVGAVAAFYGGMSAFQTAGGKGVFGIVGLIIAVGILATHFKSVRDAVKGVTDFLVEHKNTILTLIGVITGIIAVYRTYMFVMGLIEAFKIGLAAATYGEVGATYALTTAQKIAAAVGRGFALAMAAVNAVLDANPIALIILAIIALVAAFVILWKKNDAFRAAVIKAWNWIKAAAKKVWPYLVEAFHKFIDGVKWGWEKILKPTLAALWTAIKWTWEKIVKPYLALIVAEWKLIFKVMSWAWTNILEPTFKVIWNTMKWLWEKVVHPYLRFVVNFWTTVFKIMKGAWTHVLWPVFDLIFHAIAKLWKEYIKPYLGYVKDDWHLMSTLIKAAWDKIIKPTIDRWKDAIQTLWEKVLKPIFGFIKDKWHDLSTGMKYVWDTILKPIWDHFRDALDTLKDKFHDTVQNIKSIWNDLKKALGTPIWFVLQKVMNEGLIAGFNKVADFVGSKNIDNIPTDDIPHYARGGVMPGYTPGRDVHDFYSPTAGRLRLSGGEAVMRPEWTAAVGPGFVDHMNRLARTGGVGAVRKALGGGAYAAGGILGDWGSYAKGGLLNPDDKVYFNGMAISRIAAAQVALARKYFGIAFSLMQGGYGGNNVEASGNTHDWPGVGDFAPGSVNAETALRKVAFAAWARNIPGRSTAGSGAHVHAVSLIDPGNAGQPQLDDWARGENGLADHGSDPAPHFSWIPGLMDKIAGMGISTIHGALKGAGAPSFPQWILDVAKNPVHYFADKIMGPIHDFTDKFGQNRFVEILKEVPGKVVGGLAHKVIDILPNTIHQVVDTGKDLGASVGNALLPGSPLATGGVVGRDALEHLPYNGTMMYDAGGYLPPGLTSVVNLTGKPEPVFTDDQFKTMDRGGDGFTYAPTFNNSDLTAEDVMDDLEFTYRKINRRGGKYEGVQ